VHHALVTITNSPNGFGGVSTWIERVTEVLPQRGWRVSTVTHARDERQLADWAGNHPGIVLKPILGQYARLNEIEPALNAYLDREKPDVVIIACSFWMIPVIQQRKSRGENLRLVGIAHADSNAYYDGISFYRDCFDHVVGVSQACRDKLVEIGCPTDQTSLLVYGVPMPPLPPRKDRGGPLRLVYAGRLIQEQKRILDFIPLVRALEEREVDYRLDFYGSGEDGKFLQQQLQAIDRRGRVTFHGWVPADQVAETVWADAEALVMLSQYEGFSISLLEAMSHGVVPVVTRVSGGTNDVVHQGETGFSFEVGDVEECARLIASLDSDRAMLARLSERGHLLVKNDYSIETHAEKLAGILDQTLRREPTLTQASYMGSTAGRAARLVPGRAIVAARRMLRRGDPANGGFTTFP
jgi:glycosyltransferase involved in cell wall biosynthesis